MLSFHVKFVQTDRHTTDKWTDGRTDRQVAVKQYAPNLSIPGHKNCKLGEFGGTSDFNILSRGTGFLLF